MLVGDTKLFSTGVALLLQTQPHMDLITLDSADPEVFRKIRKAKPKVIVVAMTEADDRLLTVVRLLQENLGATVIAVGLEPTALSVYRPVQVTEASPEKLLAAIEGS